MRNLSFLFAFSACGGPVDEQALPAEASPPPYGFQLTTGNAVAGSNLTLSFTGAPAGATVRFAYSTAGVGVGQCLAALGGRCLDIRPAAAVFPLQAVANNAGAGSLTLAVPSNLAGRYVAFQAVILTPDVELSNPVGRAIGNTGTVISANVDGDGDGATPAQGDCADFDNTIRPNAADNAGDGRDKNCDNHDGTDRDADGYASVGSGGTDCEDTLATVNPTAIDHCNGIDDDCDGVVDGSGWGDSCNRSESFTIGGGPVDLLFMVDNSGSMAEEQGVLQAAARPLLDPLVQSGLDLHIGVVTSDTDDPTQSGKLVTALGQRWHAPAGGSGYLNWFQTAVNVGVNGSADERGLLATGAALTPPLSTGYNAGFLRPDSNLHVVFLSDEEDSSPMTAPSWLQSYTGLRPGGQVTMAHGIITPSILCPTGASAGTRYAHAISNTGGLQESICALDYGPFMQDLADLLLTLHGGGTQQLVLTAPADPATIQVTATVPGLGQVTITPQQWSWDADTWTLDITGLVLPSGTVVLVDYDV